ncbi:hypothetical protein OPQ81_011761 [Rhizoctonia solani]|nr:hypothetical protein OPQ81_011761 [Rhizoctonia solani]
MSLAFPYTPVPFNVTPASPPFHLSPVASSASLGWAPSCATPECIPNASWSTGAINSTLSFQFWGWDVALDGDVKGNMSIQLFRDGVQELWKPSGDTLFSLKSGPIDQLYQHNITLKVVDASTDAQLTVTQARVNGTAFADIYVPADRWIISSSDDSLKYTGFTQQNSVVSVGSSTKHTSSKAGDTVSMQFNGSTLFVYGPCGPASGLMTVTIDDRQQTVNTSKPFASDDCLLFQAWGMPVVRLHELLIENTDGRILSIDRLEFFRILAFGVGSGHTLRAIVIICAVVVAIALAAVVITVYVRRAVKKKQGVDLPQAAHGWLMFLRS